MELFDLTALTTFLTLGLFGSPHCVGMCGGFAIKAIAPAEGAPIGAAAWQRALAFALGKTFSYVVLGACLVAVMRMAGLSYTEGAGGVHTSVFALCVGAFCIAVGLQMILGRSSRTRVGSWLLTPFKKLYALAAGLDGTAAAFGTGLLVGGLPCGLSWSAFALATQVPVATALAGLFVFGLAAGPLLTLSAWGLVARGRLNRVVLQRLAGLLILFMGARTAYRGGGELLAATPADPVPPCCVPGDDR